MDDKLTDAQQQRQDEIDAALAGLISMGLVVEVKPGHFQATELGKQVIGEERGRPA